MTFFNFMKTFIVLLTLLALHTAVEGNDNVVFCHFNANSDSFTYQEINGNLCTHIVYSSVEIDGRTWFLRSRNATRDLDNRRSLGFFKKTLSLKKSHLHLKIIISVGEDGDSSKLVKLASTKNAKDSFIKGVTNFLRIFKFDGINVYLDHDIENFSEITALLQDLRKALPKDALLTVSAVSNTEQKLSQYDWHALSTSVDWIHVQPFSYEWPTDRVQPNVATRLPDDSDSISLEYMTTLLLLEGVDLHKLILGIPFYGREFTVHDELALSNSTYFSETFLSQNIIPYNKICTIRSSSRDGWIKKWDDESKTPLLIGSLIAGRRKIIAYDDVDSIHKKSVFAKRSGFGGVYAYEINQDDFRGNCGKGVYPLLKTVTSVFLPQAQDLMNRGGELHSATGPIIACHLVFDDFKLSGRGKFEPSLLNSTLCNQYYIGPFTYDLDNERVINGSPFITHSDNMTLGLFSHFDNLRQYNPNIKVFAAISDPTSYAVIIRKEAKMTAFSKAVFQFLNENNLDGVEIYWDSPEQGTIEEVNLPIFFEILKKTLSPKNYLVALDMVYDVNYLPDLDYGRLDPFTDFFQFILFDYYYPEVGIIGPLAPLFTPKRNKDSSIDWDVVYILEKGVSPEKLVFVVGGIARPYKTNGLKKPFWGRASKDDTNALGPYTRNTTFLHFNEVCLALKETRSWQRIWDEDSLTPVILKNEGDWPDPSDSYVISYEDEESIKYKARYAKMMGFGGMGVSTIGMDDALGDCKNGSFPLVRTAKYFFETNEAVAPEKVINCYWSDEKKLSSSSLDPYVCTHITLRAKFKEGSKRLSNPQIEIMGLRKAKVLNPQLRLVLQVAGSELKGPTAFSKISNLTKIYGFDTVSLAWNPKEQPEHDLLEDIQILRKGGKHQIILSTQSSFIKQVKNWIELIKLVEFIEIQNTGKIKDDSLSEKTSLIDYLTKLGVPSSMILIPIEIGGRLNNNLLPNRTVTYAEVCEIKKSAQTLYEGEQPYFTLQSSSVAIYYDDETSIKNKLKILIEMKNIGGVSVIDLNSDDSEGVCNQGKFPLTRVFKDALNYYPEDLQYTVGVVNLSF